MTKNLVVIQRQLSPDSESMIVNALTEAAQECGIDLNSTDETQQRLLGGIAVFNLDTPYDIQSPLARPGHDDVQSFALERDYYTHISKMTAGKSLGATAVNHLSVRAAISNSPKLTVCGIPDGVLRSYRKELEKARNYVSRFRPSVEAKPVSVSGPVVIPLGRLANRLVLEDSPNKVEVPDVLGGFTRSMANILRGRNITLLDPTLVSTKLVY